MEVSFETKFTTFTSLITGGICAYSAPRHYLSGLTAGLLVGDFLAKRILTEAQTNAQTYHDFCPQANAIKSLSNSMPGWKITSLNMTACLVSKIALPIFQKVNLSSALTCVIGFLSGCIITRLFALDNLATWAQRTQNRQVLDQLNATTL